MIDNENNDNIENLKKRLYLRGSGVSKRPRTKLSPRREKIKTTWEKRLPSLPAKRYFSSAVLTYALIFAFIFFIGASVTAGFMFWRGTNVVSNRNIDLTVSGPVAVAAGDRLTFQATIVNRNNISLDEATLIIRYPEGARLPAGDMPSSRLVREVIGSIRPGETINKTSQVILFGPENSSREIEVTLEYRITGSNAYYEKIGIGTFIISSPPVGISIDTLPEVVSGQTATFRVQVVSNAETTLDDVLLTAIYPFGFKETKAEPSADAERLWRLGSLTPGQRKTITIDGVLSGQDREVKTFSFAVGLSDGALSEAIGELLDERIETVAISRPFINASLRVNDRTLPTSVATGGSLVRVDVDWVNNLATAVSDVEITAGLNGEALNRARVSAGRGFYRSADNVIIWNKTQLPALAEVGPGQGGSESFTFYVKDIGDGNLRNPQIDIDLTIRGIRVSEGFLAEPVESTTSHTVKIESNLQVAARAVRTVGPFENEGPMPPQVDQETTYTIIWSVSNSSNLVRGAEVSAVLPPNVRWQGLTSPATEQIAYDSSTGRVTWTIDRLEAVNDSTAGSREVAFRVGFTPSANQVGKTPELITDITVSGKDSFTETTLDGSARPITIRLSSDPGFQYNQGIVVE
ncbi:MAG: hypothetical protein WDZ85_02560 [Candidatus Paceibacterota bacterium]